MPALDGLRQQGLRIPAGQQGDEYGGTELVQVPFGTGVLERHPSLRVAFLEAGGGWVPYWLERLDEHVVCYGGYAPQMRLTPSEYFARQCWVSFEGNEHTLPLLAPLVGTDRIVWGSDYPHADSTFPGATAALRHTIATLDAETQARILGKNAAALYGLPG